MGPGGTTPIITDIVTVNYIDECEQPALSPAIGQSGTIKLYENGFVQFISPYSTYSCGPVTSRL